MSINYNTTNEEIEKIIENLSEVTLLGSTKDETRQIFQRLRDTRRALENAKKISPELLKMRIDV